MSATADGGAAILLPWASQLEKALSPQVASAGPGQIYGDGESFPLSDSGYPTYICTHSTWKEYDGTRFPARMPD
jgi:hypothetical protein